jgi:O-antigen/teichoic acid export membrane protein
MFKNLPSENVTFIVTTVGYPVLAKIQEDNLRMKGIFRTIFVNTFFIIAILMGGMASTAKALILTLVGEQWLPSVILLQMLCFVGVMHPLLSMNINVLNVVGRSDLYLKLQLYRQLLIIPNIFIGIFFGIKALIAGMIVIALFGYIIFNYESNKILNYPIREQLQDIMPGLILATSMAIIVFVVGYLTPFNPILTLTIQVLAGMVVVVVSGEILKLNEYIFLKTTLLEKIRFTKLH